MCYQIDCVWLEGNLERTDIIIGRRLEFRQRDLQKKHYDKRHGFAPKASYGR